MNNNGFLGIVKSWACRVPGLSKVLEFLYFRVFSKVRSFPGSAEYWERRYSSGGNSGLGSYNELGLFKAQFLNEFVERNQVDSVLEYGCGDGSQLELARYPQYTGFDVSASAVEMCRDKFKGAGNKEFFLGEQYDGRTADLTLSLDVIYHIVEDLVFQGYMERLFDSSIRYVAIYSSNTEKQAATQASHVKHRLFSKWVEENRSQWELIEHVPNEHPFDGNVARGTTADFYLYQKSAGTST